MRALLLAIGHGLNIQYWKHYERVLGAVLLGTSLGMVWEMCAANCGAHHRVGRRDTPPKVFVKPGIEAVRAWDSEEVVLVDWSVLQAERPTGFKATECWLPPLSSASPEKPGSRVVAPALSVEM